jgi:hypothetical protein
MVIIIVVVVPHWPAAGVKVYVCVPTVVVLMTDGDQVPVIGGELLELVGNVPGVAFWQYGPNCVNIGVTGAVIITVIVVVTPHCPTLGVNVLVKDPGADVFITEGDQVPFILLFDWDGNVPGIALTQYGPNGSNVGTTLFEITTVIVVVVAHCPTLGVKVYTVDPTIVVFITDGFQVPVIGGVLFELVGNGSGTALRQ